MTTMINQVADSLSNFAATATKLLVSSVVEETADLITLGTDLTDAIVKSVAAMAYNNGAAVGSAWVQLGNDVATAALGAFNGLVNGSQELFASIMQVLTYLTSAITTIIIDVSREATFVGELIATGSVQEAKTEEASVATYLDNHRQTINMVSGIILAVAIDVAVTVATGGTGTAEAVALTEGMMTGADIAAGAAETGAEVAASAAADAATSAVETAVETGANAGDAVSGASNISRATSSITRNVGEDSGDSAGNLGSATRSGAKAPEPAPESPTEPIQTPQPAQPSKNLGSSSSSSSSDTSSAAANAAKTAGNTTKNTKSAADLTKEAATYTRTAANKAQDAAKTARASANAAKETATTARATASSSRSAANEADQAASQAEAEAEQAGTDAAKQAAQDARSKANQADQTATKAENIASKTDDAATKAEQGAKDAEDASNKAEAIATKAEKAANKPPMRGISHVVLSEGMNAVFNILGTIGASYQDELSAIQEISQEEGIKNIVSYAMDTALNSSLQQNAMMQETEKKFNANLVNQQINLTLLQDFATNTVINAAYQSEAIGLGQEYINLLTPQPIDSSDPKSQKYCPADIGSTWGLITQINSLYPQLGLYTTTAGRPLFPYAQEIAQAPLVIDTQTGSNTPTSIHAQAITQLWFNQRVMIPLSSHKATDTLDVEFQFRNLYSLQTTTYTGLYLGGIFEDYRSKNYLDNLETTGMANLNVTHLAKMFVLIHLPDGTCNVGLYEKDGLGSIKDPDGSSWIIYEPLAKDFTTGWPIYDMKATLQGNQLSLILSRTDMPTVAPWKKTVTVSPTDQRMLGVITSGTAIEWNILQPKLSIDQISSMRSTKTSQGASSNIIEKDREILSLQRWAQLLKPTFGVFTLTALSKYQCMKGNFVYTTTNTGIKESSNQAVVDYVVFANNATSGITNVGVNPCATTTDTSTLVLLSLGSGNVYDATGKIIGHQNNLWDTYNKAHGPFASSIASDITTMQTACLALLMKPKVGVFTLDAADNTLISNELYVYTTTQTLSAKGQKNLITDYLVSSTITTASDGNKYPETVGAPPSGNTQGLLSLVTGNLYSANSLTPLDTGLEGLRIYQNSYQNLPADITKKITDSLNAYTLATNPPTATQAPVEKKPTPKPPKAIVVGSILSDNIAGTTGGISLPTDLFDLPQAKTQASAPPSTASITLQQNVASGGISFDMNLMLGNPSDSAENNPTSSTNDQATSVGKNQDTSTNTAKPTSDSNNSNSAAVSTPQPTTKTTSIKPTTNNSSTLPKKISSQPTKTTTATTTTSTTKNNSQKPQKSSKKT